MYNVIIYARVSTLIQAEQGYSIDAQLEDCRKKAQELGATNIEEYIDRGKIWEISRTSRITENAL